MISKTLLAVTLCVLIQVSFQVVLDDPTLPAAVVEYMGSRTMRYHHFLWHNVREMWLNLDASTQHAITRYGWAPPRPAAFTRPNTEQIVLEDNDSGEDFLYMHRQMIKEVNQIVAGTAYGKVTGWKRFPAPGDPKWPVPPTYDTGDASFNDLIVETKSDAFYWNTVVPFEEQITDPEYLKTITLGQLGAKLEFYIHKWMHLRFSERTEIGLRDPVANPTPNVDAKWDDLSYRWLGDTYSSHVNPVFWRIHGWVDNMIEEWRKANGLTTITWKGTWVSGPWSVLEDLFVAGEVVDSDSDGEEPGTGNGDAYQPPQEVINAMTQVVALMLQLDTHNYFRNTNTTNPLP